VNDVQTYMVMNEARVNTPSPPTQQQQRFNFDKILPTGNTRGAPSPLTQLQQNTSSEQATPNVTGRRNDSLSQNSTNQVLAPIN